MCYQPMVFKQTANTKFGYMTKELGRAVNVAILKTNSSKLDIFSML